MTSLSTTNQGVRYVSWGIDASTKYAWVNPLKVKKDEMVFNGFIEIVNESKIKPNKL